MKAPTKSMALLYESLVLFDVIRPLSWAKALRQHKNGRKVVMVIPGYGMSNRSTGLLRKYLTYLGHQTCGWGLGINHGRVEVLVGKLVEQVTRLAERQDRKITLIGWSLGGYLAREVAREIPEQIDRVITLGSPLLGGPKYTAVATIYRQKGYDLDQIERNVLKRNKKPIQVPLTCIFSKRDGIVDWRACVDRDERHQVENICLGSTHLGLGISPHVLKIIAQKIH